MKTHNFFLILFIGLSMIYCNHKQKNKILYKNIEDFSSASAYIFVDIKYKNNVNTIVMPNRMFYGGMKNYLYNKKLTEAEYIKKISNAIEGNGQIEFNDSLYYYLNGYFLNKDLALKYDTIDILKSGYIGPKGLLNDSIGHEDEIAIIYTLLRKELKNCVQNCISGRTIVIDP